MQGLFWFSKRRKNSNSKIVVKFSTKVNQSHFTATTDEDIDSFTKEKLIRPVILTNFFLALLFKMTWKWPARACVRANYILHTCFRLECKYLTVIFSWCCLFFRICIFGKNFVFLHTMLKLKMNFAEFYFLKRYGFSKFEGGN